MCSSTCEHACRLHEISFFVFDLYGDVHVNPGPRGECNAARRRGSKVYGFLLRSLFFVHTRPVVALRMRCSSGPVVTSDCLSPAPHPSLLVGVEVTGGSGWCVIALHCGGPDIVGTSCRVLAALVVAVPIFWPEEKSSCGTSARVTST